jgi:hypothetical protein
MRQMREHGTPGHKALPRRRLRHDRPFSSRPDRAEAGVIGSASEIASRRCGLKSIRHHALTRTSDSNSLDGQQACCRFSSAVAPPQQPNQFPSAIRRMQARTGEEQRGCHARAGRDRRPSIRVGHRGLVDADRWLDSSRAACLLYVRSLFADAWAHRPRVSSRNYVRRVAKRPSKSRALVRLSTR